MRKLALKNFKAHRVNEDGEYLEIDLEDSKNFLLYGDNGSGKSSIYEALKVSFFTNKVEPFIADRITSDEREIILREFWQKYNNTLTGELFEIFINDEDHQLFDSSSYSLFMLSLDELYIEDFIRLDELLKRFCFDIENVDALCLSKSGVIQERVNRILKENFREEIQVIINNEKDYGIIIKDSRRNLSSQLEIKKYFNEAKLNLVLLLLLFESIKAFEITTEKKILILDDFITSLDVANRTFLIRYIFDNFSEFQILIFTHNVYFYNLIIYLVNDIYTQNEKLNKERWNFSNLYEIDGKHRLYIKGATERVADIRNFYTTGTVNIEDIGNKLRQRFEVLLYELSKLFMIGAVEDSKKILERIENSNNLYFNNKKTASDLVDELEELISLDNPPNLQNRLKMKINPYRQNGFRDIQEVVNSLKLYQKVTLHPMSHGTMGQSSFTTNEIEESLDLLEKFENYIKDLIDSDVDGA